MNSLSFDQIIAPYDEEAEEKAALERADEELRVKEVRTERRRKVESYSD